MRLPTIEKDFWALASGEARHAESPDSFWIPPLSERESLQIGQGVRLIFEIESETEGGTIDRGCERMWVVVSEIVPPYFIGRLNNQPAVVEEDSDFYLTRDAEVPFLPEHVIDIQQPPAAFTEALFSQAPRHVWPRA